MKKLIVFLILLLAVNCFCAEKRVYGPATSTDGAVVVWDGTNGKKAKNSTVIISGDNIDVPGSVDTNEVDIDGADFDITDGGTSYLHVDSATGYVGVGTSTPGKELDIQGSLETDRLYFSDADDYDSIYWTSGSRVGRINSYDTIRFQSSNFQFVGGNLGIGSGPEPERLLHINQNADTQAVRIRGYDDESDEYLDVSVNSNGNAAYISTKGHYFDPLIGLVDNANFRFGGSNPNYQYRYDGDQNRFEFDASPTAGGTRVGIFHVDDDTYSVTFEDDISVDGVISVQGANGNRSTTMTHEGDANFIIATSAGGVDLEPAGVPKIKTGGSSDTYLGIANGLVMSDNEWATTGNNVVYIDGTVGIGEASPISTLHVKTADTGITDTTDGIIVEGTGATGARLNLWSESAGSSVIRFGFPASVNRGTIRYYGPTDTPSDRLAFGVSQTISQGQESVWLSSIGLGVGHSNPDTALDVNGAITRRELSSDPANPDEGSHVIWQSDGTGSGDDGDIMMKITADGVTKTTTLIDFSSL